MIKIILIYLGLSVLLFAQSIKADHAPLFASVIGVADNDTLNIRTQANYRSKKVGELPPEAYIGIEKCQTIKNSRWCKVYQIAQQFYEGFNTSGWVNAKYLKFDNRGYVIVDGKANCDYALKCTEGMCEIADTYDVDKNHHIIKLTTKNMARNRLKGESHFGAMTEEEGASGYCTVGKMIDDYLGTKRLSELEVQCQTPASMRALEFTQSLENLDATKSILPFLHPKKPVTMTWNVLFGGKEDMTFGYTDIKNIIKNRKTKIYWGETYGRGDDVYMSLFDYMKGLTKPIEHISKIEKLDKLKAYKCPEGKKCEGYEIYWINKDSEFVEYDWLGLVVILEKFEGKWYVVGLFRDRWTI